MTGTLDCTDGWSAQHTCHGGGLAVGAFHYMEGYYGWFDHPPNDGEEYTMVCSGLDISVGWAITGPLNGCGIWYAGLWTTHYTLYSLWTTHYTP
jgi:hypothetical protein